MKENSRIRFNPVTKEIEVEGSEKFVKTYFGKLQAMVFGPAEKTVAVKKEPKAVKATPVKTDKKKPKAAKERPGKRGSPILIRSYGLSREARKEFQRLN
jgi:hypothetical protein